MTLLSKAQTVLNALWLPPNITTYFQHLAKPIRVPDNHNTRTLKVDELCKLMITLRFVLFARIERIFATPALVNASVASIACASGQLCVCHSLAI